MVFSEVRLGMQSWLDVFNTLIKGQLHGFPEGNVAISLDVKKKNIYMIGVY